MVAVSFFNLLIISDDSALLDETIPDIDSKNVEAFFDISEA